MSKITVATPDKNVTEVDVFSAARFLFEKTGQQPPSNQQVRDYLGRGSMTTISRHMRRWRDMFVSEDGETQPEKQLDSVIRFVYQTLEDKAQQQIDTAKDDFEEQKQKLAERIKSLSVNKQHLESRLSDLDTLLTEANQQIETLTTQNDSHERVIESLKRDLQAARASNHELTEFLNAERQRFANKEAEWDAKHTDLVARLSKAESNNENLEKRQQNLEAQLRQRDATIQSIEDAKTALNEELDTARQENKTQTQELRAAEKQQTGLSHHLERAQHNEQAAKKEAQQARDDMARVLDAQNELRSDKQQLQQDKARLIDEQESLKAALIEAQDALERERSKNNARAKDQGKHPNE